MAVKDSEGRTPLMFASAKGYNEIVNYLSLRSSDLNQEDLNGMTILMHYLFKNDLKMCKKLISRGADVNYCNKQGKTAIFLCVENKLREATAFLLKNNANSHIMNFENQDACDKAKQNGMAMKFWQFNDCNINLKIKTPVEQETTRTRDSE